MEIFSAPDGPPLRFSGSHQFSVQAQEFFSQQLIDDDNRRVETVCGPEEYRLRTMVYMSSGKNDPAVILEAGLDAAVEGWRVNEETEVLFSEEPDKIIYSNYQNADISSRLQEKQTARASISSRDPIPTIHLFLRKLSAPAI